MPGSILESVEAQALVRPDGAFGGGCRRSRLGASVGLAGASFFARIFFEYSVSNFGGDQMNIGSKNWVTGR